MQLVMRRRMRDQFAFLKRFDVSQAGRQSDVKKIDRQRGQTEERQDETPTR